MNGKDDEMYWKYIRDNEEAKEHLAKKKHKKAYLEQDETNYRNSKQELLFGTLDWLVPPLGCKQLLLADPVQQRLLKNRNGQNAEKMTERVAPPGMLFIEVCRSMHYGQIYAWFLNKNCSAKRRDAHKVQPCGQKTKRHTPGDQAG